jgi:iron complex outermembrane recepter protein
MLLQKVLQNYFWKRFIISTFLIFSWGMFCLAQVTVTGIIRDRDKGNPLSGGNLSIEKSYMSTFSDAKGHYSIDIKPGRYYLQISYMGYQTIRKELNLLRDTVINFEMVTNILLGEETNIIAIRAQSKTPATFSMLDAKEIKESNLGTDLSYILQSTPSVNVTSDAGTGIGYTGISIRGSDLSRINVTLNGIPLNDAETQGVWFVDLPDLASSTENIQVQRGVGTSTNGPGAFGATINIQTSTLNQDPYAELNASGGSFNTLKSTFRFGTGLIKNKFEVDGRASFLTSDGYIDRASGRLKSFNISGGYFGKKTTIKFNVLSGMEKTYQAWEGVPKDSLATNRTYNPAGEYKDKEGTILYYNNQTDNYQQDHYQVMFSQKIGKSFNLNSAFAFTKGRGYYESYKPDEALSSYGLENVSVGDSIITNTDLINRKLLDNDYYCITVSGNYQKNEKLKVSIGGVWSQYYGKHYGKIIWAHYASNGDIDRNWYYSTGLKKDFNIFLKCNYEVIKRMNLYGDLQYRYVYHNIQGTLDNLNPINQIHKFNFFNPKAGVYFEISNKQSAYFSFGVANREPNRNNYEVADKDHMPTSERMFDYELGYNLKFSNFHASINLYYMNYKDQLVLTGQINNVGEAIMVNVPKSYRMGIEITTRAILRKWINWNLTATLSRNRIKSFTEYVDTYDSNYTFTGQEKHNLGETNLSFSPSVLLTNVFTFHPVEKLSLSFTSKYVGDQNIDNTSSSGRMLHSYFVNGVSAGYTMKTKLFKEIGFQFALNNLFSYKYESNAWVYPYYYKGQEYIDNGYFPQALINFLVGISIKI